MVRSSSAELRRRFAGSWRFVAQAAALTTGLYLLALLPAWRWGSPAMVHGVFYGFLLSLFLVTTGFAAIRYAFFRPSKIFYRMVLGGMLARFFIIGICLVLVRKSGNIDLYAFVGAVMVSYIVLQILEVRFIQAELAKSPRSRLDSR